jgi:hypothetical protein
MLSLEKGRAFAKIVGGQFDGQYLHIIENPTEEDKEEVVYNDPWELLTEIDAFRTLKKPKKTVDQLKEVITAKGENFEKKTSELYSKFERLIKEHQGKEFFLDDGGRLQLIPNPGKLDDAGNYEFIRDKIFIAAPTGSGKTVFACNFLKEFQEMFPERDVIIFAKNPRDKTIARAITDGLIPKIIDMEEKDPETEQRTVYSITPESLANSITLFDDVAFMEDSNLATFLTKLINKVLGIGRHEDTSIVLTGHIVNAGQKTKFTLSEATYITLFHRGGVGRSIEYFMREYMGIRDPRMRDRILNVPGRWICFHTHYPQFVMYETGCFLLNTFLLG